MSGGSGLMENRESPDFKSPEVGISEIWYLEFNLEGKPQSNSNLIPVKCSFAKVCGKTLIAYSLGYLPSYRPE